MCDGQATRNRYAVTILLAALITQAGSVLAQSSPPVPPPNVAKRSWVSRHPVVVGTLIGVGGMGTYAAVARRNDVRRCASIGLQPRGCLGDGTFTVGFPVLLGAGAGALGGLIASAVQNAKLKYETSSNQADIATVKRLVGKLRIGEQIAVTGISTPNTTGRIQAVGEDNFTMMPNGQSAPVQIEYKDVRTLKVAGRLGTKVGIAVGIISGVGLAIMCAAYCGGN